MAKDSALKFANGMPGKTCNSNVANNGAPSSGSHYGITA